MSAKTPSAPDPDLQHAISTAALEQILSTRLSLSSVTITGTTRTSPTLLNRLTNPVRSTGGTFSSVIDDISLTIERLRSTNCFRGIDAYLDRSALPTDAAVHFTLAEKPFYQLRTGTMIETTGERDASVEGAFLWRNLTGHCDTLKMSVAWMGGAKSAFAKEPSRSWDASYTAPFALGLDTKLYSRLGGSVRNYSTQSSHTLRVRDGEIGVHSSLGKFALASAWRELCAVEDDASPLIREEAGHTWKTSLKHEIGYDTRDDAAMPSEGVALTVCEEVTLPRMGDVRFMKAEGNAQIHVPLGASGVVLSVSARGGIVMGQGGKPVLVQDRFFLGGANSLRGFLVRGIGGRDGRDAVGGEAFYTLMAMFSVPVPRESLLWQLFNTRVHVFGNVGDLMDAGVAGRHFRRAVKREEGVARSKHLKGVWNDIYKSMRVAVGLGAALETSIGRVEINFCQVMRAADSDQIKTGIQFGISESFS